MADNDKGGDAVVEELQAELERVRADLKAANNESAARRIELRELKEKQSGTLTETEELKKLINDLKAQRAQDEADKKKRTIFDAAVSKAEELGFEYPKDAVALVDLAGAQIADDGKVTGFEKALEDLSKAGRLPMKGQAPTKRGTLLLNQKSKSGGGDTEKKSPISPTLTHL